MQHVFNLKLQFQLPVNYIHLYLLIQYQYFVDPEEPETLFLCKQERIQLRAPNRVIREQIVLSFPVNNLISSLEI